MESQDFGAFRLPSATAKALEPSICKADQESKVRGKSQHGFGNSLISFYNRVGGDEQDVSWL